MAKVKVGKNNVSIDKFLILRDLVRAGVITAVEGARCIGVSNYMWRKWDTQYADVKVSDICEFKTWNQQQLTKLKTSE